MDFCWLLKNTWVTQSIFFLNCAYYKLASTGHGNSRLVMFKYEDNLESSKYSNVVMTSWVVLQIWKYILIVASKSQRRNWVVGTGCCFDFPVLHGATVHSHFLFLTGNVLSGNWTDSVRPAGRIKEFWFEESVMYNSERSSITKWKEQIRV